ncbi:MAG TPA: hypothetical protein VFL87_00110, partial [Thermoleophilaceae bacterium]|nr:hypothetical protein [Thermoleophilaceae bacterium]
MTQPVRRSLVIPKAHVSLRYPVGWHAIRRPVSASNATQELVTVGSFRVWPHARLPDAGGLLILYDGGTRGA